ncbi:DUF3298 and DUF4163 domain-containing protein [Thalassobacillus sp. B23F22_16]|uniref:DUF3298 and DUF4163 domain-containing protein n=1 Tax=Thalassobacillus sp. B23F22_16 TaxID=3459513 RepID=UPI00373F2AB0
MKVRIVWSLLTIFMLWAGAAGSVQAKEGMLYEMKNVDEVDNQWEIHIQYPEFTGLKDPAFQEKLNGLIEKTVDGYIAEVKEAAESQDFPVRFFGETTVMQDKNFFSILMSSSLSRGNTFSGDVESFNFYNQEKAQLISLMDIMDLNKIDKEVQAQLNDKPEQFFVENFRGVRPETAFYIQSGELVLIFNKYEIAPGVYGNPEIKVPVDHTY